jgi:mannose-6-phosphate isomerase-like protein (cupin superfamily)
MDIINRSSIKPIQDACGKLQELYNSDNLSLSYAVIKENSKPHKHEKMEEVYYILKGKAKLKIEEELFPIKAGDIFGIPKGKLHSIQDIEVPIELVVVTNPKFDPNDLLF